LAVFREDADWFDSPEFSPDGQQILTTSQKDKTARLWDSQGNLLAMFGGYGHENRLTNAEFSPDGRQILTTGYDKTARLWDRQGTQKLP
jgi:WD40 repeat protein